jgi:hypothetical protein
MTNIFLASCHALIDQEIVNAVCDYFINDKFNLNRNDLFFFSTLGIQLGDDLCKHYIDVNHFPRQLLRPLVLGEPRVMSECDYAIVFNTHLDEDGGHSNGVQNSLPKLVTNIKKKIVEVHLNMNSISVYDCENKHTYEDTPQTIFFYERTNEGVKVESVIERKRRMININR